VVAGLEARPQRMDVDRQALKQTTGWRLRLTMNRNPGEDKWWRANRQTRQRRRRNRRHGRGAVTRGRRAAYRTLPLQQRLPGWYEHLRALSRTTIFAHLPPTPSTTIISLLHLRLA